MKIQVVSAVLIGLFLLCSNRVKGQDMLRFSDPQTKSLSIPFHVSQNLIIITLEINGSGPMNFVLDSGITSTIITELTGIDTLQLNNSTEVKLAGLGSGEPGVAYSSSGNSIFLKDKSDPQQGIISTNHQVYILKDDHFSLSKQLGIQTNGLIGVEFFRSFVVEINHQTRMITFHNPDSFTYGRKFRKYTELPLKMVGQKAFIEATVTQNDHSNIPVILLIDTGASLPLWLAAHTDDRISIPDVTVPALLGQGLNGIIDGVNGRVKEFSLGGYTFKNTLVSFPDSSSVAGLIEDTGRNGSLGNEILRRFNAVIDLPGNKILLKPNKDISDPFTYNKSGMEIEKPYVNLPVYTVFNCVKGSPADLAGIMEGDQIIMINGLYAKNLQLDDINSVLHGHRGNSVRMRINRNGESLKITFRLSDQLK